MNEVEDTTNHICLIFHRFLNRNHKPINIYINGDKLKGFDPFLESHPKTDTKKASELFIENSTVKIQAYILPHQVDLSNEDINRIGGIETLRSGQGFYIYRNNRLIIYGTWFKLSPSNINKELFKYGRIKVDIPNTLDDMWEIDVKKQNASIPKMILNSLRNSVYTVCDKSKAKTSKRTKLTLKKDESKLWNKSLSRNGKEHFYINQESSFIKNFLEEFSDKDKLKLINLFDIISSSIPFDDIYNSVCNKNNEDTKDNEILNTIILEGISQVRRMKSILQIPINDCYERLITFEPFNDELISSKIWEVIKNDK